MIRFLVTLLMLAAGIGLVIMAGTVLLPVVLILIAVWILAALFRPGRVQNVPPPQGDEPPVEDIPASQAVIDVEAVDVSGKES